MLTVLCEEDFLTNINARPQLGPSFKFWPTVYLSLALEHKEIHERMVKVSVRLCSVHSH